jgi:hypothetical protein
MTRWLAALFLLVGVALPAEAAVVWFSGFETGTAYGLTGEVRNYNGGTMCETGSITTETTTVRTGAYALKVASGGSVGIGSNIGATGDNFIRGYVNMAAYPSVDTIVWETRQDTGGSVCSTQLIQLWITTAGVLAWAYQGGAYVATGTTPLPLNQWVRLESLMRQSATVGGMELKINAVVEFTSLGSNTNTAAGWMAFGPRIGGGQAIFYDDVFISDTAYPGPGRIIARQATSGTPFYDTWTKNACATIDLCWSDTPFATGTSATPGAAIVFQTMLVASFSSTQTGHGTQIITASDTVTRAAVAFVTPCITGARAFSTMRRVAGVDSFLSPNSCIGASGNTQSQNDASIGGFATSLADLNAMEAGVSLTAGAGGVVGVYDLWVMVDYCEGCASASGRHKIRQY